MSSIRSISPGFNFGGGLNTKTTPSQIADNESQEMQNVVSDEYGSCSKRKGSIKYNSTKIGDNPINGIYRAYKSDGTKKFLAACNTDIYVGTDSTGAWSPLSLTLTANQFVNYATFNDLVIMTNYSEAPQKYDFSTATVLGGSPPKAKYLLVHRNYLFIGFIANNPSRIQWSGLRAPETWGANEYVDVSKSDGDVITGLGSLSGNLYIFKNRTIHVGLGSIWDSSIGDMSIAPVSNIGCVAPRSLVNTGEFFIFLAQDGIRIFNGSSSEIISTKIESKLKNIPAASYANCVAAYDADNKWYWFSYESSVNSPASLNNEILVYDLRIGAWYYFYGLNAKCFSCWNGTGDKNEFYYGTHQSTGFVYKLNHPQQLDDTSSIYAYRETRSFDLKRPEINKRFKNLYIDMKCNTANSIRIDVEIDQNQDAKNIVNNTATELHVYIADTGNNRIVKRLKSDLSYVSKIGTSGTGNDNFAGGMEELAIDETHIYVADTYNYRIVKRLKSDLSYVSQIGSNGSGNDNFSLPSGIAVDDTHIYIADLGNYRIVKRLKSDLSYVSQVGTNGSGNDQFDYPSRIAVDDTYIYISDSNNNRIVKRLKSDLTYISQIGATGNGNDGFNSPQGLAVDATYIYIADFQNSRIVKRLKSDLSYVSKVGTTGTGNDNLDPKSVTVDDRYIYVADTTNNRVVKRLKSDLSYVNKVGSSGTGNDNFSGNRGIAFNTNIILREYTNKSFNIWKEGKSISFRFSNNGLDEDLKLYKGSFSHIPKVLR